MSNFKKKRNARSRAGYRPVAIAALVASGILQPLLPVLALGTAADTGISNTATAEYKDDAGTTFDATSNTVTIKVAPVAGITVKPTGITDGNGGALEAGDKPVYNFEVTNVGNTPEDIFIPGTPTTSGFEPNSVATPITVKYQIITNGVAGTLTDVPANGVTLSSIAADQVIKVFVSGTVAAGLAPNFPVTVTLGNTGANNNDPETTQNIVEVDNAPTNLTDVRTVTLSTPTYTVNREASASQFLGFATSVKPQAFALIKKTASSVPGASASGNDDVITYNLNFSVLNNSPNGSYTPADLEGTNIDLDTGAGSSIEKKILVSDAIPAGTVLTQAPAAVAGWTAVYSTDSVDATIPISSSALGALPAAKWTTTAPTTPAGFSAVKRIGFIANATSITAGAAAIDLPFNVVTSGLPVSGGKVYNIAQAFGQTKGDATNQVVVDESGDPNASNFNDDGTVGTAYNPASDTGKADPVNQGLDDPQNPNTGVGPNGEDNVVDITGTIPPATDGILNGPNGSPAAIGPTDENDDFTNASTKPPAGQDPTKVIAAAQSTTFTNTIKNPALPGPGIQPLAAVTVQPISPTLAEASDGPLNTATGQYGKDIDIPTDTLVTLTDLTVGTTNKPVVYKYDGSKFVLQAADTTLPIPTQGTPLNFGSLAPGAVVNYTVKVELPASTVKPLVATSIPLVAFTDDDPTGNVPTKLGFSGETVNNITIDRVYTGYMKLVKEARILAADESVLQDWTDAAAAATPGELSVKPAPGQFIEYRIRYQNISTTGNASGNAILNAKQFTLTEDGVTSPNNWASVTTHQQKTTASPGSTLTFFNNAGTTIGNADPSNNTEVGKYQSSVPGVIAPGDQGVFQFRRLVNESGPSNP
jgi:hypothetical protein